MEPVRMHFFVEAGLDKDLTGTDAVTVWLRPSSLVLRVGLRGAYREARFEDATAQRMGMAAGFLRVLHRFHHYTMWC